MIRFAKIAAVALVAASLITLVIVAWQVRSVAADGLFVAQPSDTSTPAVMSRIDRAQRFEPDLTIEQDGDTLLFRAANYHDFESFRRVENALNILHANDYTVYEVAALSASVTARLRLALFAAAVAAIVVSARWLVRYIRKKYRQTRELLGDHYPLELVRTKPASLLWLLVATVSVAAMAALFLLARFEPPLANGDASHLPRLLATLTGSGYLPPGGYVADLVRTLNPIATIAMCSGMAGSVCMAAVAWWRGASSQ